MSITGHVSIIWSFLMALVAIRPLILRVGLWETLNIRYYIAIVASGSELRKEIHVLGLTLQVLWLLEILSGYVARGMERSSIFNQFGIVLIDQLSRIIRNQDLEVLAKLTAIGILNPKSFGTRLGVDMTDERGNELKVSFTADRRRIREQMTKLKAEIERLKAEDNKVNVGEMASD